MASGSNEITGGAFTGDDGAGAELGRNFFDEATKVLGAPNSNDSTLDQAKYDFTSRSFPLNLGTDGSYGGHYMVINISVPDRSTYDSINGTKYFTRTGELSKTDALRFNIDKNYTDKDGVAQNAGVIDVPLIGGLAVSRPRFTSRIVESIALRMPENIEFGQANEYDDINLTDIASSVVGTGIKGATGFIGGLVGSVSSGAGNAVTLAGDVLTGSGSAIGKVAAYAGRPINPKVEFLYKNTPQREFLYDFLLAPDSEAESLAMEQIIKMIRFHAAPEVDRASNGFTYTPPSEFDITWYYRGVENTKIPRVNTCVLTRTDINYAPQGQWATFSNGHPVACRFQMKFQETEVNSKLRIAQGF